MKGKVLLKSIVFVVILSLAFGVIYNFVIMVNDFHKIPTSTAKISNKKLTPIKEDPRNFQRITGFYDEPENSLDAVYIGSSNCYVFWNSLFAWQEHGIAVWPYAANGLMFESVEYLIREGRKTQKDALYIVNVNSLTNPKLNLKRLHYTLDYMAPSLNKSTMVRELGKICGSPFNSHTDFWVFNKLKKQKVNGLKGVTDSGAYLPTSIDVTEDYVVSDEIGYLPQEKKDAIHSLLDYCDEENVNILFVTVPRAEDIKEAIPVCNAANRIIESRGYPTLYLTESLEEMNLDMTIDYYHKRHTNIHGSIKFTQYMSEYLIDNYGFKNKKADKSYESWNEGWKEYTKVIEPWILDLELDVEHRDFKLRRPEFFEGKYENGATYLWWSESQGAEKYEVYRKIGREGKWIRLGEYAGLSCTDYVSIDNQESYYRVVPCYDKEEETYYGAFDYNGVKVRG